MKILLFLACIILAAVHADAAIFSFEFTPTTIEQFIGDPPNSHDVRGTLTANFGRNYAGAHLVISDAPFDDAIGNYYFEDPDDAERAFIIHGTTFTGRASFYKIGGFTQLETDSVRLLAPEGYIIYSGPIVLHQIDNIPEPYTWTLMISGFGVVGCLSRRQRSQALAA